jgi:hypothetical protein
MVSEANAKKNLDGCLAQVVASTFGQIAASTLAPFDRPTICRSKSM